MFSVENLPVKLVGKDTTYVFTINSERVKKYDKDIVGYCNNFKHRGFLSKQDITEHECLDKRCPYLMKLTHKDDYWNGYIQQQEMAREQAEKKKKRRDNSKTRSRLLQQKIEVFIKNGNDWLSEQGYDGFMEVIGYRIEKNSKTAIVTYVSDRKLDFYEFNDVFYHFRIQAGMKTRIVRAKNSDGSYATLSKWRNSKRYKELIDERAVLSENEKR